MFENAGRFRAEGERLLNDQAYIPGLFSGTQKDTIVGRRRVGGLLVGARPNPEQLIQTFAL